MIKHSVDRTLWKDKAHIFYQCQRINGIMAWLSGGKSPYVWEMVFSRQLLQKQNFIGCQQDAFLWEKLLSTQETNFFRIDGKEILHFCSVPEASTFWAVTVGLHVNTAVPFPVFMPWEHVWSEWSICVSEG